jgi:hypothetical protein
MKRSNKKPWYKIQWKQGLVVILLMIFFGIPTYILLFKPQIPTPDNIRELNIQALWPNSSYGGNRQSYLILLNWKVKVKNPEIKKLIYGAIKNIESYYATDIMTLFIERQIAICKYSVPPCSEGYEPPIGYNAKNVFEHLSRPLWTERARAACLLRNIETSSHKDQIDKKELCSKLINLMKENENSLFVSKMAFETYKSLTGFSSPGVFDFDKAIEDWNKRKGSKDVF